MLRKLTYTALFLAAFGTYVLRVIHDRTLNDPPEQGDGHDYDAIAFNLWQNQGFGYNWDDPAWRQPYEASPEYQNLLNRHSDYYSTTYRPPGFPFLLSLVYDVTGRNFAAGRIVNCALMAGAVTFAAAIAAELAGLPAAVITVLLALQIPLLTLFSHQFMTEALATFLVTLLAWMWLKNTRQGWTLTGAAASGLVLGALVVTRSVFALCLPLALVIPGSGASSRHVKAICLLSALLVIGPWWVRNIVVTRAFMPMGTEGGCNLPAGFGPRGLRFEGMWASNPGDGEQEIEAQNLNPTVAEVRLAQFRTALALDWMWEHPSDVLRLAYLHVWQEARPRGDFLTDWLLPGAALGALLLRKSRGIGVVVLLVCANILGIAMTWSVGGRFMVPVQPLLAALVAAMAADLARRAAAWLQAAPTST